MSAGSLVSCTPVSPCALLTHPPPFASLSPLGPHCPSGPSGPPALQVGSALGRKEDVTGPCPSAGVPGSNTGLVCEDGSVLVLLKPTDGFCVVISDPRRRRRRSRWRSRRRSEGEVKFTSRGVGFCSSHPPLVRTGVSLNRRTSVLQDLGCS